MTVILIHGMFCGNHFWHRVDELLHERGIATRKVDLHPHGEAKCGRGFGAVNVSVRDQLVDLYDQPVVLVGHSLGALVVQKILTEFPRAIPVLVNPSPGWGFLGPMYPLWVAACRGRFWNKLINLSKRECRRLLFQGMSDSESRQAMDIVEPESGELVRQAFWFYDLLGRTTWINPRAVKNMSIVTGSLDPMGSPAYCKRLSSRYACDNNPVIVEKMGHWSVLQEEGAQKLVEQIRVSCARQEISWVH